VTDIATRPLLLSPCCRKPLEGGPAVHRCTGCRKDVHGSIIEREFGSAPADCTYLHSAFGPGCPYCTRRSTR
jgi:hypothetical protein